MAKISHSKEPGASEDKAFSKFFVSSWGKNHDGKPNAPADDELPDLLLELTLAAAYSNLVSNIGFSDFDAASSFMGYFVLVWWVWASQVAYNTRFRTRDWVHRLFSGAQFVVFCAMTTFSSFSIGVVNREGLGSPAFPSVGPIDYHLSDNWSGSFAFTERELTLPLINGIGVAVTMGCSRIFLGIQYLLIFVTAHPRPKRLLWHIISLLLSSMIYVAWALYMCFHGSETIMPFLLLFIPVILEAIIHLAVIQIKDHDYDSRSIARRSATLFIIVLGEGLNQITGTFKYVIDDVGVTSRGPLIMLCVGAIVIGELSLYCRHNWKVNRCGPRMTLVWFFSHFWLMAALILTLQSVRTLVSFANMYSELHTVLGMMNGIIKSPIEATMISDAWWAFQGLGIPFDGFMDKAKNAFMNPQNHTAQTQLAQAVVYVASVTMGEFNAFPPSGSLLFNHTETFLFTPNSDPTKALPLLSELLSSNLVLARWFWGFAGASLMCLAFLHLVMVRIPKDIFETLGILSRITIGAIFIILAPITHDKASPWFDTSSGITAEMHHSWFEIWAIPMFAFGLVLTNAIDPILKYLVHKRQQKIYQPLPSPGVEGSNAE